MLWKFQTEGEVFAAPAYSRNVVFVGSRGNTLYALSAENGELRWKFKTEGDIETAPIVGKCLVF